MISYKEGA